MTEFALFALLTLIGAGDALTCLYYDRTTCKPSTNKTEIDGVPTECLEEETCAESHKNDEIYHCHALYNLTLHLLTAGCFSTQRHPDQPICPDECIMTSKFLETEYHYCCCSKDLCNINDETGRIRWWLDRPEHVIHRFTTEHSSNSLQRAQKQINAMYRLPDNQTFRTGAHHIWATILAYTILPMLCFILLSISIFVIYRYRRSIKHCCQLRRRTFTHFETMPMIEMTAGYDKNKDFSLRRFANNTVHRQMVIGKGRFGEVYKALWNEQTVALKKFASHDKSSWLREQRILSLTGNHPNIIRCFGAERVEFAGEVQEYCLLFDYHSRGSLKVYIKAHVLSIRDCVRMTRGILNGLAYLHEDAILNKPKPTIIHRDFKASNILVTQQLTPVICDFGLGLVCDKGKPELATQNHQVGTMRYMSPELLARTTDFTPMSFRHIDEYACAIVLWEVVSRTKFHISEVPPARTPFEQELGADATAAMLEVHVSKNEQRPTLPAALNFHFVGQIISRIITEMWAQEAEARISASCAKDRLKEVYANIERIEEPIDAERVSASPPHDP